MWTAVYHARHVPPLGTQSDLPIRPSPVGRGGGGRVQVAVEPTGALPGG